MLVLRLYRLASFWLDSVPAVHVYCDAELIDVSFDFGGWHPSQERFLTKVRMARAAGTVVSLEMRGGVIFGVEILGFGKGRLDSVVERFSDELPQGQEIPLLTFELDGGNSDTQVEVISITQAQEFGFRWAEKTSTLEISFGEFHRASDFGCGAIYYNSLSQVSGVRIRFGAASSLELAGLSDALSRLFRTIVTAR